MRIFLVVLATVVLCSPAHAVDQLIKLPKPGELHGAIPEPAAKTAAYPTQAETSAADQKSIQKAVVNQPVPASNVGAGKDAPGMKERMTADTSAGHDRAGKPPAKHATVSPEDEEQQIQALAEKISMRLAALRKAKEAQAAQPPQPPQPPRARPVSRTVATSLPVRSPSLSHTQWGYEGEFGPSQWGKLNPSWARCDSGARQSPIDIRDGIPLDLEPIQFDYKPTYFTVTDNGHTVQVGVGEGSTMTVGGRSYQLSRFQFRRPSEERINGKSYPMSMHLVHHAPDGRQAVLAILIEEGSPQATVQQVWNNLPLEKNDPVVATTAIDLAELLPARRKYYTYMGSMTTPPCNEGVLWIVLKEPIQLSSQQIAIFSRLYPLNARPIQAARNRLIKESN